MFSWHWLKIKTLPSGDQSFRALLAKEQGGRGWSGGLAAELIWSAAILYLNALAALQTREQEITNANKRMERRCKEFRKVHADKNPFKSPKT
jgi:hypothetical protein